MAVNLFWMANCSDLCLVHAVQVFLEECQMENVSLFHLRNGFLLTIYLFLTVVSWGRGVQGQKMSLSMEGKQQIGHWKSAVFKGCRV